MDEINNTKPQNSNYKTIILVVSAIVLVGLISYFAFAGRGKQNDISQNSSPTLSPSSEVSPSASPRATNVGKPSAKDLGSLTPQEVEQLVSGGLSPTSVPYSQLTKPATCQISGGINFLSATISESLKAKFAYTGIDSPARQIKWKIIPTDSLRVGPNLAASLKLPDGESPIIVSLPASPISKKYTLSVSMTYGRLEGQGVRIYEANCSGEVIVDLSF